ncbi:hypothetical protein FF38_11111 [Lucilia cuprina]|uniref:THAP-type domain-containing protein n=1 Tax=Lucilia cuprina TaxID=7375 RepID=A0A0L0CR88_LUCCU|nr:hypothetical protein FF38_11111 [Lucilia cuprina]
MKEKWICELTSKRKEWIKNLNIMDSKINFYVCSKQFSNVMFANKHLTKFAAPDLNLFEQSDSPLPKNNVGLLNNDNENNNDNNNNTNINNENNNYDNNCICNNYIKTLETRIDQLLIENNSLKENMKELRREQDKEERNLVGYKMIHGGIIILEKQINILEAINSKYLRKIEELKK